MSVTTTPGSAIPDFAAVIPAGGVGSRLWPLSRPESPKFLLDLLGTGKTMLQDTVDRLAPIAGRTMVVTGAAHRDAVVAQVPGLDPESVLAEPSPRDSMAAIALAAAVLEHRHGPLVMGSFAADHVIRKVAAFDDAVRAAIEVARLGKVVTIGIAPTGPSSAYGYIESGAALTDAAYEVTAFTEKPDATTAQTFLETGRYVWNAGMFVTRTDVLLSHLARLQPTLEAGVRTIAAAWDTPERDAVMAQTWPSLTKIAIDHAIAEPVAAEGGVAVVPADLDWYDVGDFDSLASLLAPGDNGAIVVGRSAVTGAHNSDGALVVGGDKAVVVIGVPDVIVIDTPDALLVTTRSAAQDVKIASSLAQS